MRLKSVLLCSMLALLALPAFAEAPATDLTLDEVLDKYMEARGGREAWDAIETARMTGKMMMGGGEAPFSIEFMRPSKVRIEFTFQGMTGIQAYDGETGWFVMPFMGKTEPEKMADDQLKMIKDQSDLDGPLVDYGEKGHQVELLGKEEADGTEAYKLKVTKKGGDVVYVYLDAEHFLEFKNEAKITIPQQGTEVETTVVLGDYKEVGGVLMAHSIEQTFEGAPAGQTITIDKVELNADVDASRFEMPASEPAAEGEDAEAGGK